MITTNPRIERVDSCLQGRCPIHSIVVVHGQAGSVSMPLRMFDQLTPTQLGDLLQKQWGQREPVPSTPKPARHRRVRTTRRRT